jgi:hypothetical protein
MATPEDGLHPRNPKPAQIGPFAPEIRIRRSLTGAALPGQTTV